MPWRSPLRDDWLRLGGVRPVVVLAAYHGHVNDSATSVSEPPAAEPQDARPDYCHCYVRPLGWRHDMAMHPTEYYAARRAARQDQGQG